MLESDSASVRRNLWDVVSGAGHKRGTGSVVTTRGLEPSGWTFQSPYPEGRGRHRVKMIQRPSASQERGDMLRPHDLRHTCASLHIRHGTPPKVLPTMLGHASVAITLDRYGHLYPGDVHLYVDRLGRSRSRSCGLFAD